VMRGNGGHGSPVRFIHLCEEGDGQRLLARQCQPQAAAWLG
jgi:hypothetical protein